jgi:UPF0716 protein FxsA
MPLLLVLLFIVVPIAELFVIIQVGEAIGVGWTIALLVVDSLIGAMLLRAQGRTAWRRFSEALGAARVPGREVADGVLVIFGGALLLTPGFITDVLGLLFLLPPTRAVIRRVFLRGVLRRVTVSMSVRGSVPRRETGRDGDIDGTAVDIDARPGQLGA